VFWHHHLNARLTRPKHALGSRTAVRLRSSFVNPDLLIVPVPQRNDSTGHKAIPATRCCATGMEIGLKARAASAASGREQKNYPLLATSHAPHIQVWFMMCSAISWQFLHDWNLTRGVGQKQHFHDGTSCDSVTLLERLERSLAGRPMRSALVVLRCSSNKLETSVDWTFNSESYID